MRIRLARLAAFACWVLALPSALGAETAKPIESGVPAEAAAGEAPPGPLVSAPFLDDWWRRLHKEVRAENRGADGRQADSGSATFASEK
jgi:hypothetical protein